MSVDNKSIPAPHDRPRLSPPSTRKSKLFWPGWFVLAAAAGSLVFAQPCGLACVAPVAALIGAAVGYAAVHLVPRASRMRAVAIGGWVLSILVSASFTWWALGPPSAEEMLSKAGLRLPEDAAEIRMASRHGGIDPAIYLRMKLPRGSVKQLQGEREVGTGGWFDWGARETPRLPAWWRPAQDGVSEFWSLDLPDASMVVSFAYSPPSGVLYVQFIYF